MTALRGLTCALSYFTILPLGRVDRGAPDRAALAWLPPIGALLGAIYGGAGWLAWAHYGAPWSFVVPFVLAIVLTGAIHLDGFLDCCDGLLASVDPERRREILKDPHHGTFAIVGMVLLAAVWLATLARFPFVYGPWFSIGIFAFASYLARCLAIFNLDEKRSPNVVLCILYGLPIAFVLPAAGIMAAGFKHWACTKIGGAESGDIYGAMIVLFEVVALVGFAFRD